MTEEKAKYNTVSQVELITKLNHAAYGSFLNSLHSAYVLFTGRQLLARRLLSISDSDSKSYQVTLELYEHYNQQIRDLLSL